MIFSALRGLSHFWQFGTVHTVLLPLTLLAALAVQLFVINREKRPWLPLAVCGGVIVLCDIAVILATCILGRGAILLAILGMGVTMYLLAIVLGFTAALLIGRLTKKIR